MHQIIFKNIHNKSDICPCKNCNYIYLFQYLFLINFLAILLFLKYIQNLNIVYIQRLKQV